MPIIKLPKQEAEEYNDQPFIDDHGIYMPVLEYGRNAYRQVMTKDLFVEAYNRYIRDAEGDKNG